MGARRFPLVKINLFPTKTDLTLVPGLETYPNERCCRIGRQVGTGDDTAVIAITREAALELADAILEAYGSRKDARCP